MGEVMSRMRMARSLRHLADLTIGLRSITGAGRRLPVLACVHWKVAPWMEGGPPGLLFAIAKNLQQGHEQVDDIQIEPHYQQDGLLHAAADHALRIKND